MPRTDLKYQSLHTHLCTHAQKTILMAPIHLLNEQIVPLLYQELLTQSLSKLFSPVFHSLPIKCFQHCIILCFIFIAHFLWACVNPGSFSNPLFVYSFLCPITHSFLNGCWPNLKVSTSPMYAIPAIIFSLQ